MTRSQARRYARAFLAAAPADTQLEQLADQLEATVGSLGELPQLALSAHDVRLAAKAADAVRDALEGAGVQPVVRHFVALMVGRGQLPHLERLAQAVRTEVDQRVGVVAAEIRSARPLDKTELAQITQGLERALGKRVRAESSVDPSLIAGVVARAGDVVFDGSVRRQLGRMRDRLLRAAG